MEELPLFGRRFSATTKDEKTRAALGIFAHYDKLLLYRSNTHTLLVSKNNTKKSPPRWSTQYVTARTWNPRGSARALRILGAKIAVKRRHFGSYSRSHFRHNFQFYELDFFQGLFFALKKFFERAKMCRFLLSENGLTDARQKRDGV